MKLRAVVRSLGILLAICFGAFASFYLVVDEELTIKLKIQKSWTCDTVATDIKSTIFYFPNRGGASGPNEIDSLLKRCPEIKFDKETETLLISKGKELQSLSIKPLEKWRLDKSLTYGYPIFMQESREGLLHVYAIDRTDIGLPK